MKKTLLLTAFLLLTSCSSLDSVETEIPSKPHVIQDTQASIQEDYLGSDYKGNYVWGGAMNLAWTDLSQNIIEEPLKLNTEDSIALGMAEKFNDPIFTKNDLDAESYYIKSGYGQETVEAINQESKEKFPDKSFGDLKMDLSPEDIIAYAYFLKDVEYASLFKETELLFGDQNVQGFYANNEDQKENVKVVHYENDDKFIVRLALKDKSDQLFLAKGYPSDLELLIEEIRQKNQEAHPSINSIDEFITPKLLLDYHRDYVELIGKSLLNDGFDGYEIAQMYENIKFDMDEKGARVENEAVIELKEMAAFMGEQELPESRKFILDKPYWVIMKRADSENPYFILGVNNTALMENVENQS